MAVETDVLDEPEAECKEKDLFIQICPDEEILGTFSKVQDLPLKKAFHPLEVATTKYFMQQLQQSLVVKTEPTSDYEVESSGNEYKKRTRRRATDVRLIYSDSENESDVSEFDPEIFSSSKDESDSLTDDWTPKGPAKKRKKIQKKKKNSPEVQSCSRPENKTVSPEETVENTDSQTVEITDSQQSDCTNQDFICEVCNKTFENKKGLLVHTNKAHMSNKPYACNFCDKMFASSSNLQKHVRVHTQEKPYSCTICDKKFADGSNMRKHMEIHGVPHVCNGCDKELQHSLGLQSDETMHNNCTANKNDSTSSCKNNEETKTSDLEQSYECKSCGSNFTVKAVFEKHLKLHEICKNYQCSICDRSFCSANDLLRHEVKFHGKVQQVHEERESKTGNGSEQITLINASTPDEKPPQNFSLESNKIGKKIPDTDQRPFACNGDAKLPISLSQMQKSEGICTAATDQKRSALCGSEEILASLNQVKKSEIIGVPTTDQKFSMPSGSEELPIPLNGVKKSEKIGMLITDERSTVPNGSIHAQFSTSMNQMQKSEIGLSSTDQSPVVLSGGVQLFTSFNQVPKSQIVYMPPSVQGSVVLRGSLQIPTTVNQVQNTQIICMPSIQQQPIVLSGSAQFPTSFNQVPKPQTICMPSIDESPAVVGRSAVLPFLLNQVQKSELICMPSPDQRSVVFNGNVQLPTSLDQLQKSERICTPATNQNGSPELVEQCSAQTGSEVEKLHSFVGVETNITSCERERPNLSVQRTENTESGSRNSDFPSGCQKTNITDYEIDVLEKQKVTNSLNAYHELLVNLLDGKENAHERRETNQGENKSGNVLDKRDSDVPVLGLVQNILTTNLPPRLDLTQENSHHSTFEMTDKSEEDMNSLGIFFEN